MENSAGAGAETLFRRLRRGALNRCGGRAPFTARRRASAAEPGFQAGNNWRVFLAVAVVVAACEAPSDVIVEPASYSPVKESNGRFRVTYGAEPAEPRGFTVDGRLVIRTRDLQPFGPEWVLLSVPVDSGYVREEAAIYRQALIDEMAALGVLGSRRVLAAWTSPLQSPGGGYEDGCPGPAPPVPSPKAFTLYDLPPDDGVALRGLPTRSVDARVVTPGTVAGPFNTFTNVRVRVTPAMQEVRARGGNPFGPVLVPGGSDVVYSDGEGIWRASMADASQPAQLVAAGAYPALSSDGNLLAYARPLGVDSASQLFIVPVGLGTCIQEHVEITATGWEVVVRDLSSGDERVLGDGIEPQFDPLSARLVVRVTDLVWIDLAAGSRASIDLTVGAFAPTISPDGNVLAFALADGVNASVFFLPIAR